MNNNEFTTVEECFAAARAIKAEIFNALANAESISNLNCKKFLQESSQKDNIRQTLINLVTKQPSHRLYEVLEDFDKIFVIDEVEQNHRNRLVKDFEKSLEVAKNFFKATTEQ